MYIYTYKHTHTRRQTLVLILYCPSYIIYNPMSGQRMLTRIKNNKDDSIKIMFSKLALPSYLQARIWHCCKVKLKWWDIFRYLQLHIATHTHTHTHIYIGFHNTETITRLPDNTIISVCLPFMYKNWLVFDF